MTAATKGYTVELQLSYGPYVYSTQDEALAVLDAFGRENVTELRFAPDAVYATVTEQRGRRGAFALHGRACAAGIPVCVRR